MRPESRVQRRFCFPVINGEENDVGTHTLDSTFRPGCGATENERLRRVCWYPSDEAVRCEINDGLNVVELSIGVTLWLIV